MKDHPSAASAENIGLAVRVAAAFLSNHKMEARDIPRLLQSVHAAICELNAMQLSGGNGRRPAAPVADSIQRDHLVCLEDGKKLVVLTRYLRRRYGLTPDQYRKKWRLPPDYPMTAPAYGEKRSKRARKSRPADKTRTRRRRPAAVS